MRTSIDKDAVLAHFQRNAGQRFDAIAVARHFGASEQGMRHVLGLLRLEGRIKNESGGGGIPGRWFIPATVEAAPIAARPFRMKELSAQHIPSRDYDRRRAGSGDMLRVKSKHV